MMAPVTTRPPSIFHTGPTAQDWLTPRSFSLEP